MIDLSFATVTEIRREATQIAFRVPVTIGNLLGVLEDCRHFLFGLLVVKDKATLLGAYSQDWMRV